MAQKTQNGGVENNNVLHQQWNATTSDGAVVFRIIRQPESQHRARYQTEGSRGAIKDRVGTGFPTLKLEGYSRPAKIQIFIGNDTGRVMPHMFYQVCRVTGKNSNPCDEKKMDGTDIIEISFEPQVGDMTIVCDCVGILKERFADVEARFPKLKTWKNVKKKSTKCRLVFRTVVENSRGEPETLQVVSDVINCTQLPGTPEILKMSATGSSIEGGEELWIIGKNFLKDTKVIFSYSVAGKTEPLWSKFTDPDQDLFHQTHLITTIPPFYNPEVQEEVEVTVFIKCGDKLSDPVPFIYRPKPLQFTYSANPSHPLESLPRGVAAPAVAIAQQYAQTGNVSILAAVEKVEAELANQPRPTILEPLHDHKNKKSRLEYVGKNARRTRSVPRPNLINEDTVFVSEGAGVKVIYTSFAQNPMSPWKGQSPAPEVVPSVIQNSTQPKLPEPLQLHQPQLLQQHQQQPCTKRSFSFNDESSNSDFSHADNTRDTIDNSHSHGQSSADFSSSLTTDFSNVFRFKPVTPCEQPMPVQFPSQPTLVPKQEAKTLEATRKCSEPLPEETTPRPPSANTVATEDNDELPNVSVKATSDEKATISISLPTSILKDRKHFQNVIETINNTLLRSSFNEPEETEPETRDQTLACSPPASGPPSNGSNGSTASGGSVTSPSTWPEEQQGATQQWTTSPPSGLSQPSPPLPTSHPVSVLSNRKRNFSSEPVADQLQEFFTSPPAVVQPYEATAQPYEATVQPYEATGQPYEATAQPYEATAQPYEATAQPYEATVQPYEATAQPYEATAQPYDSTAQPYKATAQPFEAKAQPYEATAQPYVATMPAAPITGCTSVISKTPVQTWQPAAPAPAFEESFKPMEVTPPPEEEPFMIYQESLQEKKWNAEFNEVLQTVIEDHKEDKTMEWSTPTPVGATLAPVPEQQEPAKTQGMEWALVKETPPTEPATQFLLPAAPPAYPAEPAPKNGVQYLDPPNQQPQTYDEFGSEILTTTSLTNTFPVPALPVLETVVVERAPMADFAESLVQIQGDPMLSETSSVIGVQKEIESAYRPPENEPELGQEQPWGHEWTYGAST